MKGIKHIRMYHHTNPSLVISLKHHNTILKLIIQIYQLLHSITDDISKNVRSLKLFLLRSCRFLMNSLPQAMALRKNCFYSNLIKNATSKHLTAGLFLIPQTGLQFIIQVLSLDACLKVSEGHAYIINIGHAKNNHY